MSEARRGPVRLPPGLRDLVRIYPTLPPAERRVADAILAKPDEIINLTTSALAARAAVSQSVASRMCGRLGTRSFQAFKVRLAQELGAAASRSPAGGADGEGSGGDPRPAGGAVDGVDRAPLEPVLSGARDDFATALRAVATLDPEALVRSADALLRADSIVICGFDLSGAVAKRLASLLHRSGLRARPELDPHNAPWATDLGADDVLMVISYRGRVPFFIEAVRSAHERGVTLLVMTNEIKPELPRIADILLLTHAPSAPSDTEYTEGPAVYVQLAAARALWQTVRQRKGER